MSRRRAASRTKRPRWLVISGLIVGTLFVGAHPAAASPPTNGQPPTLSGMETGGDVYVGSTLYATAGRWSGVPVPTYSYRWQYRAADGTWPDIAGATGPTYAVQPTDFGYPLRVNVTAANSDGTAEQVSAQTNAVKNAPPAPPIPPDPPPDILGSPLNSRVVSADSLLITRDVDVDGSLTGHRQSGVVAKTTSDGRVGPVDFQSETGQEVPGGEHYLPRVTAAGRFMDPDFDSVLTLESRHDTAYLENGPLGMVLRSTSSDVLARGQGDPSGTLEGGKAYQLQDPNEDPEILNLTEVTGSGSNSNVEMAPGETSFKPVAAANWTAVAVPASGAGTVAIVNRVSGRCLGVVPGTGPYGQIALAWECAWDDLSDAQQWTSTFAGDVEGAPTGTLVNPGTGLALTRDVHDVTVAPLATPPSSDQQWIQWEAPVASLGPGGTLLTGDDVPAYRFSADPLTYTMAAGDLDRVSEYGDTFQYHDEAVMAWVPNHGPPTPPTLRVVDYVSSGVVRPVPRDLDVALPAPGAMQGGEWMTGSLGLAVGDFDGDSLNEIAYVWQDSSGTFRLTMLEYRRNPDQTRSLRVVGPVDGIPLFTGTGAPTPRLEAGLAEAKAGDFDGDGRDDVAIAFAGTPAGGADANAYVGVVSFTQELGVRGQQYSALSSEALNIDGVGAQSVTRGMRLAPGLFRFDPDVGYTMERRQLAVAWSDTSGSNLVTKVAVYSIDPDPSCTQATCALTVNEIADTHGSLFSPAIESGYPLPLSLAAGGFRGRGSGEDPPLWGIALGISDREEPSREPDGSLATWALVPDDSSTTGFSLDQLQFFGLNPGAGSGATELYTVTAFDPAGASLALGAPAVVQVQNLQRATMVGAQPPTHADWDWEFTDPVTKDAGAFVDVSRFSNFTVTLGSTSTQAYQHTHTDDATWNAGVTQSLDVKGSFNNDLGVEATSASVEAKEKFKAKWTGTGGDFSNSTSQTSSSLIPTSNDDDLFAGSIEDSTLYRYPILGGPLRDANGDPVPGTDCGQTCYGVYEVSIPGKVVPINTAGRSVDFFEPSWENGNALSYPLMSGGDIPTPDIGAYTYVDSNGTTQSVTAPLLKQAFGVDGNSTGATMTITGTTGSGNSSGGGKSWDLSGDVKATGSYRLGTKAFNLSGSVSVDVGGFGGKSTSTNDTGQTINTSASAFVLNVPEIVPDTGYSIGTAYYYDTGGAARVNHAVDLTSNSQSAGWWTANYGRKPDPALNLPNRIILDPNPITGLNNVPHFVADARHQLIRGFQAFHTSVVDSPSFANKEYTTNPIAGDEVRFQVPVRNYSLDPLSSVAVSFYAVPMMYDGVDKVPAGPPVAIGDPQTVDEIKPQGSVNVSSPVWKAVGAGAGIQDWRIFVVLDEKNAVDEIHEWKDAQGPCPPDALEDQPADKSVINGVMVDPMTGKASTLACGQNNQGFGEISVSASAPAGAARSAEALTVLDMASRTEPNAPGVHLTRGGMHTDDPATEVLDDNEVARVRKGQQVLGVAYVGSKGETPYHQTVLVYDGPPETGEMVAVTKLRGATAADGHRVAFTWRPDKVGRHTLHVRLLGHVAAGEDDLLTIPVLVEEPAANTAPVARDDAYSTREDRRLTVRAPGVLRNDRDPEGGKLTASRVDPPENGSLSLNGDGSFTYRPDRRFAGNDSFTYRAGDGPLTSDPARVRIRVRRLPTCHGRRATIVGTRRGDVIRGTARADVIVAFGGKDRIRARGGNDRVCAGDGRDVVVGGAGRDRILGGTDGDRLRGDSGADLVDGGRGHDTLVGGSGRDELIGRVGRDRLFGGPDDDALSGGPGNDFLAGNAGRNRLFGGVGNDILVGRPGLDLLRGGPGRNRLFRKLGDVRRGTPIGRRTVSPQSRGRPL